MFSLSSLYYWRWPIWPAMWYFLLSPFNRLLRLFFPHFRHLDKEDTECLHDIAASNTAEDETQKENTTPLPASAKSDKPSPPLYRSDITYICVPSGWEQKQNSCPSTNISNNPEAQPGVVIYYETKGTFLAWGGTAVLERLPSGLVVKTPIPNPHCPPEERERRRNMRLEAQIYNKLGEHPRVPGSIAWDPETCCLTMEYLENGNLREYIREKHAQPSGIITPHLRLRWAKQAAEGVALLHAADVIHCDLSARNFLLDSNLNLKISDFGGASLGGSEPSACPATRYKPPGYDLDAMPMFRDDIFSLGSLIYFIMTGSYPYEEVASDEVEKLYEAEEFPEVSNLICGKIIQQCWCQQVDTAQAVADYLTLIQKQQFL